MNEYVKSVWDGVGNYMFSWSDGGEKWSVFYDGMCDLEQDYLELAKNETETHLLVVEKVGD